MATAKDKRYGRVFKGHTTPYGAMAGVSLELRNMYYSHGYLNDEDLPPLPCPPHEDEPYTCPEEELFKKQMVDVVATQLDTLSPRASKVLRLRFGFGFSYDMTLEEVGRTFDVTRERIRQIEAKALRDLKHPNCSKPLRDLIEPESEQEKKQKEIEAKRNWEARRRELFEMRKAAVAKREAEVRKQVKRDIANAYLANDTRWLEFFKAREPELFAEMEARVKETMEKYDTTD